MSDDARHPGSCARPSVDLLALPGATVAALAVDETGAVLAEQRPDAAVAPASNTKLVTAALALSRLGPDHRFETALRSAGSVDGRTLDGDLVVRGGGDPALDTDDVTSLAAAASDRFDRVTGDVVLDTSLFAGPRYGPGRTWDDARHAYGAPTDALALARNCVTVTVCGTDDGVEVTVAPETNVRTAVDVVLDAEADADDVTAETDPDDGTVAVTGRLPPGVETTVEAPVRSPARQFGRVYRRALADEGIAVDGGLAVESDGEVGPDAGDALARVRSPPLWKLVREMNVPSDNVVADTLARAVAAEESDEGSWEAWQALVTDRFDALGRETVRVRDGSGLSRYNRVTPRAIVDLLSWVAGRPWEDAFVESLPTPGEGTLADRLDGVSVRAKTGTLTGTRALSGRLERDGRPNALFSVVFDDLTTRADEARDRQDAWVRSLAE